MNLTSTQTSSPRNEAGMLTQTAALFVDAYRDLNARKLFWLTLILSMLAVAIFAFITINEKGIVVFGFELPIPLSTRFVSPADFYKTMFTVLGIDIWLSWIAAILALVSVGAVFPDLLTSGSIDLYLSRPIARLRLFLTKYLASLLFVALQVTVFTVACIILIGVKSGLWEFRLLLAVPIVTLMFSYIYSICVLLGIVTRSTLASILITLLIWVGIFGINTADEIVLQNAIAQRVELDDYDASIANYDRMFAENDALPPDRQSNAGPMKFQRDGMMARRPMVEEDARDLEWWSNLIFRIKTMLPKTAETTDLLNRWLVNQEGFLDFHEEMFEEGEVERAKRRAQRGETTRPAEAMHVREDDPRVTRRLVAAMKQRSLSWILGTSVAFEAVVLGIAAWIFCRRDF